MQQRKKGKSPIINKWEELGYVSRIIPENPNWINLIRKNLKAVEDIDDLSWVTPPPSRSLFNEIYFLEYPESDAEFQTLRNFISDITSYHTGKENTEISYSFSNSQGNLEYRLYISVWKNEKSSKVVTRVQIKKRTHEKFGSVLCIELLD